MEPKKMKKYTKLPIPKDSAWDDTRFKWGGYVHWRIRYFFQGIWNIIRWMPTLYKDKDWDDYYITKILQKKIEFQRKLIVNNNRHTRVDMDNYWMTVVLNLIELEHEDFYSLEKYNYITDEGNIFEPKITRDDTDMYLAKYPASVRRVKQKYPNYDFKDKQRLSLYVGIYNQERCRNLIFEILKRKSAYWWE